MKVLLILPPLTQINSPYPSTAYLAGYLRSQNYNVEQRDLGLELILRLFSREGLMRVRENLHNKNHESVAFFLDAFDDYAATIEPTLKFLRGDDPSLSIRLAQRTSCPKARALRPSTITTICLNFLASWVPTTKRNIWRVFI